MLKARFGRVINLASVTGPIVSNIGESAYSVAKAGMVGLTLALALEAGPLGVTVNAIAPGWIDTGAATSEERAAALKTPLGRAGTPDEVAACALFLASDQASYIWSHACGRWREHPAGAEGIAERFGWVDSGLGPARHRNSATCAMSANWRA